MIGGRRRASGRARPRRALILGGGIAGIAAAFELRERGCEVDLLEARSRLGGRVFSLADSRLGDAVDNGPHVILGCYVQFRRLLRRLGTESDFARQPALRMAYRAAGGSAACLRLRRWPTPLALPAALLRLPALAAGERARALLGVLSALRGAPAGWSLERWLEARGQRGGPRRLLWEPLCLAVMNAEPRDVSAALFLAAVRRAFGGSAARAALWIPQRPWSQILGEPAERALARAGVRVRLRRRATSLRVVGDRVVGVELAGGESAEAEAVDGDAVVVSALPWRPFAALHGAARRGQAAGPVAAAAAAAAELEGRDIVNVAFDCGDGPAPPDEGPIVALVEGRPFQFLYRRPGDPPGRFVLIASACEALAGATVAEIERQARAQLGRYYPGLVLTARARVRVTKEASATLAASPAAVDSRPAPGPCRGFRNLWICGDWTQTGLPSTIEGAAESAARMVRACLG